MTIAEHPFARHGPSSVLSRLLLGFPMPLYRAGLGWLFGHRLLMLTHRGRRTSTVHQTVVEVVHYDQRTQESIVTAGWGTATQWYRNIQVEPAVEVETGGQRYAPVQRFLGEQESREVLQTYALSHRVAGRLILQWLGYEWTRTGRDAFMRDVRLVAFRPRRQEPGEGH